MPDVFDHVTIRVTDIDASRRFYGLALETLGYGEPFRGGHFFEWEASRSRRRKRTGR